MQNAFLEKLKNGTVKREDLIEIRAALKKDSKLRNELRDALLQENLLLPLLCVEDNKSRKNTALLIGELGLDNCSVRLYEAYRAEATLFVRPAYLEALLMLKASGFEKELEEYLNKLEKTEFIPEEQKHVTEEIRLLRELTGKMAEKPHTFTGFAGPAELLLNTAPGLEQITADSLQALCPKIIPGGVRVSAKFLRDVLPVRTFEEILFLIPNFKSCDFTPEAIAVAIAESRLLAFLDRRHKEQTRAYRFRVELKARMDAEKRSKFIKKLSGEIESHTNYALVNSTGDYEIELRVFLRKNGKADCLLKLFTLPDTRFAYRSESIAAGLKPVTAALAIAAAKPYLKENAQVLDPFCGVGTLLIERAVASKVKNLYGIDTYGKAVEKARINSKNAGLTANYINRNFFDFKHDYLFDELITELPALNESATPGERADMKLMYHKFLEKACTHLNSDATVIILVKEFELLEPYFEKYNFELLEKISLNNGETEFVLRRN